ncbi:MAG: hypothetical protein ACE5K8_03560 [Candidatus Zixiibacteriota bacterium]
MPACKTDKRAIAIIFFMTIFVRLLFHYLTGFTYDDAFITFRYAENIANGHGFVYNVGEKVLGTTTPLFTLILAALASLRLPVITGALFVSLLASGLTAVILYRFARSLGFAQISLVPVTLYMFFPRLLATDTGGMETPLFTLLVTAAFYFQHRQLPFHAVTAAALATVTRPEGLLPLGIIIAYNGFKDLKQTFALGVLASLIILPWAIFAGYNFGSPVPNSVAGKLSLYSHWGVKPWWGNLIFIMGWHHPFGIPLFLLAVVGAWWLIKQQKFGLLEITWLSGMFLSLTVAPTYLFLWYITPIYPIYFLFVGGAFCFITGWREQWRKHTKVLARLVVAVTAIVLVAFGFSGMRSHRSYWNTMKTVHQSIGLYLREHAHPTDVVAAEDIGYIGYYSGLKILDRDGLISPEVIPYNREKNYLELILDKKPEWLVADLDSPTSQFISNSEFTTRYRLAATFKHPSGQICRVIFSLADST